MAKTRKYKPRMGDEIEFMHKKVKHTGHIGFIGAYVVSVYPHTITIKGTDGKPVESDWWVDNGEIIGAI